MRIAHITATFPPEKTGTGNVAYHNAVELARRGHELHVFTALSPGQLPTETMHGIAVHRLRPLFRYGNAPLLPSLFGEIGRRKCDMVHLHMPFYGGAEAIYLLCWRAGLPLVITHHQDVKLQGLAGMISRVHDRIIGQRLMRRADRACFTSLDYAYASQFAPMIASHRLRPGELPNGVDVERFVPGERAAHLLHRYHLDGRNVVLFVGVLDRAHYFKGVHILLEAMQHLHDATTALVVVGKGDLLDHYRQQADTLGIADRLHFAGFVPDAELADYYRLADVTVLPSTTAGEAFGLVLIESLACGTPVIATALPGVRTVVADGQDGLLVAPGSAADLAEKLRAILTLPAQQRHEMGMAGRRKVEERYAWPQIGTQLESLYNEILHERQIAHRKPIEQQDKRSISR